MQLVPCAPPLEPLVAAPRTALLSDSAPGNWDGFWSETSDAYYVCRTLGDGSAEWFQLTDESEPGHAVRGAGRILVFPGVANRRPEPRAVAILARSPNGRGMLVGATGRKVRG